MQDHIRSFMAAETDAILALCAELVAAPSFNPPGDTRAAAGALSAFFGSRGLVMETVAFDPEKPNLVLAVDSGRPGPHLVFNGHLDTIRPGDEASWTVPAFTLSQHGGRFYGLGIGNMKAGIAALAFATLWLAGHRDQWHGRLSFTAVADETVFGPDGAEALLAARPDLLGDALICAEGPGFMQLGLAEKGVFWVLIEAVAPPLQGMMGIAGQGAVVRLAKVLLAIDALNDIHCSPPGTLSALADGAGEHGLRLSANIGTIAGGSFVSQGAERAVAEVDFRVPPGLTLADVASRLDAIVAEVTGVAWTRIKGWEANWTPPDAAISRALADACQSTRGAVPQAVVRLPASDASRWRAQGVPAVCFGPQPLLVSGVDDYVIRDDLIDCAIIYTRAALSFLCHGQGARS